MQPANLSTETIILKLDRLGDRLAHLEMINGENPPADWQQRYNTLESRYNELEAELDRRSA